MKTEMANKIKLSLFFFLLIVVIVGGYILMVKSEELTGRNRSNANSQKEEEKIKEIRKNPEKDYIYFENPEMIAHELDIEYKNIVLNFKDENNIASTLNNETASMKESLKYDKEAEDAPYDSLVEAKYKKYEVYTFENYISLLVNYYRFNTEDLVISEGTKSYVFDKRTGDIIAKDDLLKTYGLTNEDVNNKIKTHIADQDLVKEEETLDAQATINAISEYALYVDKLGKLTVSLLVKSDQKDYNDIVILN